MVLYRRLLIGVLVVLAAGTHAPLSAQDATTATPEAEAPAEPATEPSEEAKAPTAETTEDTAEPGEATADVGDNYIAARFTDWVLACENTGTGNDPCRFIQILANAEGGRIAQVSILPLPEGRGAAAAAIIETPLGTLLRVPQTAQQLDQPGGIRIKVDNGETRVFQFTFCNTGGCVAEIGMTEEMVNEFKRGNVAQITIWSVDAPGRPVEMGLSLSGFTAGFNRIADLSGAQ